MKIFVYPTGGKNPTNSNPYIQNLKNELQKYYDVLDLICPIRLPKMLIFLLSSTKANIYILNWIENSSLGKGGFCGAIISLIGLIIVKMRHAKIVWIYHNIHPHSGETFWTRLIKKYLFSNSSMIISHSNEGAKYAMSYAKCPVVFKNHPFSIVNYEKWDGTVRDCDFFYWSSILPYKGILEFLKNPLCNLSGRKILIVGKCSDEILEKKIESVLSSNIIFENRRADFREIAAQCKRAKYVIFPYIGNSISSSGVLMDTLMMGGTPVGPNRGAFYDLAAQRCCITYDNIDEVFSLPIDDNRIQLNQEDVQQFINSNTWEAFGGWLSNEINSQLI